MRLAWVWVALGLLAGRLAGAQPEVWTLDELLQTGQDWLEQNIDPQALESLGELDEQQVQALFRELEARFQGEYVADLAPWKPRARALVPLLRQWRATRPYAGWLAARLDYLDVADEYRLIIPAPAPQPGEAPKPAPNPSPDLQRRTWQKQLEARPLPTGADRYVPRLKPIFLKSGAPAELVWLAEVESSFDPEARSPAGAVGLYQLMPATARSLGLSLSPRDERLVPEKNAAAAARYLKYLHGRFGEWRLALAAYNAGEGRVRQLLTRHRASSFDGIATRLPAETQMYVPKIEATLKRREATSLAKL